MLPVYNLAVAFALSLTPLAADEWVIDLRPQLDELGLAPRNQGKRGTCSVFAALGVCEYEWARTTGKAVSLSAEYLNWARHRASPAGSDGGCFHDILAGLHRYGVCAEELMPYRSDFVPELVPSPRAVEDAMQRRGMEVTWIKTLGTKKGFDDPELRAVLTALRAGHPVAVGLTWYKGKDALKENALLRMDAEPGGGHSVILVGYRENAALPGSGAFLVRNHGGTGYGMGGYMQMPFAWLQKQGNDAFFLEAAEHGSLSVAAEPAGATVTVEGFWRGKAPVTFESLPAGMHRVRIGAKGVWCLEQVVAVKSGEEAQVSATLKEGGPPPVSRPGVTWRHELSGLTFVAVTVPQGGPARLALNADVPQGAFWIGRTETSNAQYKAFVDASGYVVGGGWQYEAERANLPAVNLTYDDAVMFSEWLGGRLPTEGEWEWAARGPTLPPFPWGHVMDAPCYVGRDTPHHGGPMPVDSLPAGASWCGALHMVGNVSEWCLGPIPSKRPRLFRDANAFQRAVLRGGSFRHASASCRPTWRYVGKRSASGALDGFRLVIPAISR